MKNDEFIEKLKSLSIVTSKNKAAGPKAGSTFHKTYASQKTFEDVAGMEVQFAQHQLTGEVKVKKADLIFKDDPKAIAMKEHVQAEMAAEKKKRSGEEKSFSA